MVRAEVIGSSHYTPECNAADRYYAGRSGRTLRVSWRTFRAYRFGRLEVREAASTAPIDVIARVPIGPITLLPAVRSQIVSLAESLAGRRVLDGETGRPLRTATLLRTALTPSPLPQTLPIGLLQGT
jgi:hypothetical protein